MASFEIATKADVASVLPGLLIALHLQQEQTIPTVSKSFHDGATLPSKEAIQMTCGDGKTWSGKAIVRYLAERASRSDSKYLLRVSGFRHHRTGRQWNIYPTYDFCAPILDSIENITVALRTNEYRDRNVQYEWMQDTLGLRKVPIWDFSVRTPMLLRFSVYYSGDCFPYDDVLSEHAHQPTPHPLIYLLYTSYTIEYADS